ncbi:MULTISPECIES: MaoC family dehydratase [Rhodopseudomonas]|uniref:MaoC family dehydratase n=1 Tax=Rhodopseudomonas TaxID=1073 RepID=UPI0006982B15|nr:MULTISPECIES: MaoC family dehydratase [Rhodopseudomonas]MDF3812584.1 MaoC family dehydratase [Rhodopseudomonas sp. BAL398]WOK17688.1 MaoC family dehydratase [Rhodopseudomonas sp. BAL398]
MADIVALLRLTMDDQEAFARLSGDRNPIHMDAAAARRTQAGACVAHGMHILLWAIENLASSGVDLSRLKGARAKFVSFVPVGSLARLSISRDSGDELRIEVARDDGVAMIARLDFSGVPPRRLDRPFPSIVIPATPLEPDFGDLPGSAGRFHVSADAIQQAEAMFPTLCQALGISALCELALMSTVVGMVAPGLHSILSEISVKLAEPSSNDAGLGFAVARADSRFRRVDIEVEGKQVVGNIAAFARLAPPPVPSIREAAALVAPGEFRDRRALVVGGSRGLGAATATLLAAGGACVTLSYCEAQQDADLVADDIRRACGIRSCEVIRYDAGAPAAAQLSALPSALTHAYYFATPRIFGGSSAIYTRCRLDCFLSIYVDGFVDLIKTILQLQGPMPLTALYPSTVAIDERPTRMTEYAMAKAAGEIVCADLVRAVPGLTITAPRLPRVATAQTATVPPVSAADPLAVMLPLLRQQAGRELFARNGEALRPALVESRPLSELRNSDIRPFEARTG